MGDSGEEGDFVRGEVDFVHLGLRGEGACVDDQVADCHTEQVSKEEFAFGGHVCGIRFAERRDVSRFVGGAYASLGEHGV